MIKKENLNVINYFNLVVFIKSLTDCGVSTVLYPVKLCFQKSSKTHILKESDLACDYN